MATTDYSFDVVKVLADGGSYGPYNVSDALLSSGWHGGTWIKYSKMRSYPQAESIIWEREVDKCGPDDPVGFILRGSYEPTDQRTSYVLKRTGVVTICTFGQYLFKYYERYDLAERTNPGSGAPLVYSLNIDLYVSVNGLLTTEDETGSGRVIGICCALPADNRNYLGVDVLFA